MDFRGMRNIQHKFTHPITNPSLMVGTYPASFYQSSVGGTNDPYRFLDILDGSDEEQQTEERAGVERVDVGSRGKKKRASEKELTSSQPKKTKQEEGCISSEIVELKEKVDKLEANLLEQQQNLLEQQQKFLVLERRLNSVTENRRSSCVKMTKVVNLEEEEIHEQQILRSFRPRLTSAMENSLIHVADDLYSHDLIDEHTKRQAVALQTSNMSPHQRCSLIMDILIASMECIDEESRRQTFVEILNVFKKYIPLRYVAVKAEKEYASVS